MFTIVLDGYGNTLEVDEKFSPSILSGKIGRHGICGGAIEATIVSGTHRALSCDEHNFMMYIPIEAGDYSTLRQWCEFCISHPGLSEKARGKRFLEMLRTVE